ncbi:MAG TPA: cell division protein FtsZ [Polyangia bacterium]|jgi:cell division protein FtsZ|nr:cell division protein FtsZ [Polyangia bacterium]
MLEFDDEAVSPGRPAIKVIGVGGGGGNAVNTMIEGGIEGVDFIVSNTDCQVLDASLAGIKVHLGKNLTKGLGAGANPEIGRASALEDVSRVAEALTGADMVFVTAGMGGGTGTGAAPVIAQVARDLGALTVGVVTKPFAFEGSQRKKKALAGIAELSKAVDALIVIPNDRLIGIAGMKMTLKDAFAMVDNVCLNAVRGISDLVIAPGLINVDFADVRTIMTGMGRALMGTGRGHGDKRAVEAAQQAISSPLLEDVSINGATGILLNITGGPDLTLAEMNEACSLIAEAADPDANIIFGSVIDAHAGDEVRITVIATGFQSRQADQPTPNASPRVGGGGGGKRHVDQMPLPMQSNHGLVPNLYSAPVPMGTAQTQAMPVASPPLPPPAWNQPAGPTPRGGYAAPRSDVESIEIDDFYAGTEYNSGAVPATMAPAPSAPAYSSANPPMGLGVAPNGGEWTPAERPIIRPPVAPTAANAVPGRRLANNQVPARPADELGVEESEFDKPTYLRRGIFAPE